MKKPAQLLLLILILILISLSSPAQVVKVWDKYIDIASGVDEGKDIAVDSAGYVYVAGYGKNGSFDSFYTLRFDPNGYLSWSRNFNSTGPGDSRAEKVGIDQAGNIYVGGTAYMATGTDMVVISYDYLGNQRWVAIYDGGFGNDSLHDMEVDGAGNVYIAGSVFNGSNYDFAVASINASGAMDWKVTENYLNDDNSAAALARDPNGNIYATGYTHNGLQRLLITYAFDFKGNLLWNQVYGTGNNYSEGTDIVVDASGNSYLTGKTDITGSALDIVTIKYSSAGTELWKHEYNYAGDDDVPSSINLDPFGNIFVSGTSKASSSNNDIVLLRYYNDGSKSWEQRYDYSYDDFGRDVTTDKSGNAYVACDINTLFVIKWDSTGSIAWYDGFGIGSKDAAAAIGLDTKNNILVTGTSASDIATGKFCQKIGSIKNLNGLTSMCPAEKGVVYSVDPDPLADYYLWRLPYDAVIVSGDSTNSITVDYSENSYSGYVEVWAYNDCGSSYDYLYISIYSSPPSVISQTDTLCTGDSVQISAPGGYNYLWNNGSTTQSIYVSSGGKYTVTVTDPTSNCASVGIHEVLQHNLPDKTITANGPVTFCEGGTVTLSAKPGYSYLWNTNDATPDIFVSISGNYYATLTSAAGCTATSDTVAVTVNPIPTNGITPGGPTVFCTGDSVVLTADSSASYLWNTGEIMQSIVVKISGDYYVTITSGNGCSVTSGIVQVSVSNSPPPSITISGDTVFCEGNSVTLTSSAADSYLWSTGETTQSIIATLAGKYAVTVTNTNVCNGYGTSDSVTVIVNMAPDDSVFASGPTTFCSGSTVDLTAFEQGAGITYYWSTGETTRTITVSQSGSYWVMITNNGGCSVTSPSLSVTEDPIPAVSLCMVTVDSISKYNRVIWEKPVAANIDSFRVYREMVGGFKVVRSVPYSGASVAVDSTSSPNTTFARYRITALDTCGNESSLSNIHRTMFLQANLGVGGVVNLNWTQYLGDSVDFYRIMRDNNGTGNFIQLDSVPSSNYLYTDTAPPANPSVKYSIEVVFAAGCNASFKMSTTLNITRSNIKNIAVIPTTITTAKLEGAVSLFPNPAKRHFTASYPAGYTDYKLTVVNVMGQTIHSESFQSENVSAGGNKIISLNPDILAGIYFVMVEAGGQRVIKKLVIE